MLTGIIVLAILILIVYAVLTRYPAFGGRAKGMVRERMVRSKHFVMGKFVNGIPTTMKMSMKAAQVSTTSTICRAR